MTTVVEARAAHTGEVTGARSYLTYLLKTTGQSLAQLAPALGLESTVLAAWYITDQSSSAIETVILAWARAGQVDQQAT